MGSEAPLLYSYYLFIYLIFGDMESASLQPEAHRQDNFFGHFFSFLFLFFFHQWIFEQHDCVVGW